MKIYAILGNEKEELEGILGKKILKAEDFDDAVLQVKDLSFTIMSFYNCVYEELEKKIEKICNELEIPYGFYSKEEEYVRDKLYDKAFRHKYYELDLEKLPTLDIVSLEDEFYHEPRTFLRKYAKRI